MTQDVQELTGRVEAFLDAPQAESNAKRVGIELTKAESNAKRVGIDLIKEIDRTLRQGVKKWLNGDGSHNYNPDLAEDDKQALISLKARIGREVFGIQ